MVIYAFNCNKSHGEYTTTKCGVGFRCTTKSDEVLMEELVEHHAKVYPGYTIEAPNLLEVSFDEMEKAYNAMKENKDLDNANP